MLLLPSMRIAAKERPQGIHIPFSTSLDSGVILTRHGDLVATWKLSGLPFEGLANEEMVGALDALNLAIQGLATGHFAFWVHRIRRRAGDRLSAPKEGFAKRLIDDYYAGTAVQGLAAVELFFTLVYRPYPQRRRNLFARLPKHPHEISGARSHDLEALANGCRFLQTTLTPYLPVRLEEYIENETRWSAQLEFYDFLINGRAGRVAVKNAPLYNLLPNTRKLFGNELFEIRGINESRYGSFLDLQDYADSTGPGILNPLLRLRGDFIETHSFSPLLRLDAAAGLKRRTRQLSSVGDDAPSQRADMTRALDDLASGRYAVGAYHYSLLLLADTESNVKTLRAEAADLLQRAGFRAAVVDVVPDAAYWAQLPGNWAYRPRIAEISSRNFIGLASLHNFNAGKRDGNPWGEALTILRSPVGQALYFNCHATRPGADAFGELALGSTQIIGQSGEGKTVLAGFIAANLLKYDASLVWFDKDRSAEVLIRALGGTYLRFELGEPSGLAPFKRVPSEDEIQHWVRLLKVCATLPSRSLTIQEELDLEHAARAMAVLPESVRSFGAVLQNLPKSRDDFLHGCLARWCTARDGPLAWALDGERDVIGINPAQVRGFDYTELLEQPDVLSAVMLDLLYRTESMLDGRRFVFFMEEYWRALENPIFEDFAKNKQKTIRKQNGFGIYLTQSPSDTLQSPIARSLIEQTATFIFLPNPAADFNDYVQGFKLTPAEFDLVRSLPRGSRLMLIKQGSSVSVGRLDLAGVPGALAVLAGSTESVARLERLRGRLGEAPEAWLEAFIRGES